MQSLLRLLLPAVLAGLLSACGGGIGVEFVDDFDDHDHEEFVDDRPFPSGRPGSVTVRAATEPAMLGTYASSDVRVTHVFRFFPLGEFPETCRFQFEGLLEPRTSAEMAGEILYLPGTDTVHASFIVIDFQEFRVNGNATLDRAGNAIVFDGAVLTSTQAPSRTITISGTVPMQNEPKPAGC